MHFTVCLQNVNTCPVDRLKFNQILVYTSLHESPVKKVVVPDNALLVSEDETFCEVRDGICATTFSKGIHQKHDVLNNLYSGIPE